MVAGTRHVSSSSADRASSVPPLQQQQHQHKQSHQLHHTSTGNLNIPVQHERTAAGYASESELSQYDRTPNKRWSLPVDINIDTLHSAQPPRPRSVLSNRSDSATRGLQAGDLAEYNKSLSMTGRFQRA